MSLPPGYQAVSANNKTPAKTDVSDFLASQFLCDQPPAAAGGTDTLPARFAVIAAGAFVAISVTTSSAATTAVATTATPTVTTATAAIAATTVATTRAIRTWPRFVDRQIAAAEVLPVKLLDRRRRIFGSGHFDKPKTA